MFNDLPKSWNDITVAKYEDILTEMKKEQLLFSKQIQILSILTNVDLDNELWDDLSVEDVTGVLNKVKWLFTTQPSSIVNVKDKIQLQLDKVTLGEFIDLEYYFTNNFEDNLHVIFAILLRKTQEDKWVI